MTNKLTKHNCTCNCPITGRHCIKCEDAEPHICEFNAVPVVCRKCSKQLLVHEVEILNSIYDIGTYCGNESCEMYEIIIR